MVAVKLGYWPASYHHRSSSDWTDCGAITTPNKLLFRQQMEDKNSEEFSRNLLIMLRFLGEILGQVLT
jgi:hypothetical protein